MTTSDTTRRLRRTLSDDLLAALVTLLTIAVYYAAFALLTD